MKEMNSHDIAKTLRPSDYHVLNEEEVQKLLEQPDQKQHTLDGETMPFSG